LKEILKFIILFFVISTEKVKNYSVLEMSK